MNKYTLGTIAGTALLGLIKAKSGARSMFGGDFHPSSLAEINELSEPERAKVIRLYLNKKDLKYLPHDIFMGFSNLKHLHLGFNQLTEVPDSISNLTNLEILELESNSLEELPPEIGNLSNLIVLDVSDNKLKEIPNSIGNLTNLIRLTLYNNKLEYLPESIVNLINLKSFHIEDNPKSGRVSKSLLTDIRKNGLNQDSLKSMIRMYNSPFKRTL